MNIWKLGCNWGTGQPFFDDFLRTEKIVLGWTNHNYAIDDIVLIAKGHTIIALTRVIGNRVPITSKKEYEEPCDKYNIEYYDQVYFTKVDWIDLKNEDYFKYELRQGICQVRNTEIQYKAKSLYQNYMNDQEQFFLIPLNQISNWEAETPSKNGILAEVPILQRGLVWKQSQIELLWDSILRGIPIGSLILCPINDSDSIQKQKKAKSEATHFILDGQQRYNAISMGFSKFPDGKDESNIIWLDLNPDALTGTREFLVRLTTKAHPWGFDKSDDAGSIGVNLIRKKIIEIKGVETDFANYIRPNPNEIFPFEANCPIPLSLLLNANEGDFWGSVYSELQKFANSGFSWAKKALSSELINEKKDIIQKAIATVKRTKIIALNMPDFLLNQTKMEESIINKDGITNIEHLFRRINSLGTTLNGEELVYSMIKSHFPEIAKTIDDVAKKRMPSSKLVQLSIRLALSDEHGLKGGFNVSQIRRLASSDNTSDKDKVMEFINNDLKDAAETVDKWLTNNNQTWGIPRVLKTGIAISSPDVYCLLLYLAQMHPNLAEEIYKRITGIALLIHWFVDDKGKAVSSIYKAIYKSNCQNILFDLTESLKRDVDLKRVLKTNLIDQIIQITDVNLASWKWDSCKTQYLNLKVLDTKTEEEKYEISLEYEKYINPFLIKLKEIRELLLYAQRDYLRKRFHDYDPARKDLWEHINRPWDFDHILPNAFIKGKWDSNPYKTFCSVWVHTNGNLRAWPFEDNRSDQADKTSNKMKEIYWEDSFIHGDEKDGYSDQYVIDDADKAFRFAKSCKSRMIRIYQEWYNNFNIEELLE